MSWSGLHGQHTANAARSLLNGNRAQTETVQLIAGKAAGETKPLPVVVNNKDNTTIILP